MIKLKLKEISIPEKQWKIFRKEASTDELFILGVGVQYKLTKMFISSIIYAIGLIASIIAGIVIALTNDEPLNEIIIMAICYIFFAFMCTKKIRYQSTYTQLCKNLNKEDVKVLDNLFSSSAAKAIIDVIVGIIISLLTIPYQILMMIVGLIAPKFVISKNGVLVAVPKGYGLDALELVGAYYSSISLFDEITMNDSHKYEIEIINDMGCKSTLHSANNKDYYDESGTAYTKNDDGTVSKK